MTITDQQLVADTLRGDPQAFEEIVRRYQRRVFSIIYHYLGSRRNEVEDLAQEVFMKVFRSLSDYDPNRPLQAWVARIAVNTCLDQLRRIKIRKTSLFSDLTEEEEEGINRLYGSFRQGHQLTEAESEEAFSLLQKLVSQLSAKDRTAFILREMQGLGYSDIGEVLECSEVAVRIRVSRARKQLLENLKLQHFSMRFDP
jgi:RNA polymerase sigma-70 factor (ECF subfamily)